ncbi:Translation initiation factor 2B subunit, eIF-2B alpha/beta/delta family [Halogranum amylolyticum]|uniref:Translation initiation factor 2B subunit, eIF-2B alpha/beta/delta family n=1 Tax=Halogranum amylolyticum TaxID=660520 RepID=A0A1H8TRB3_9EURY|nr:NUDIX domain-containing protein [Halogranum amylolyticum]SEO93411.1 Translation initiation factor 2B subunit, eIF-2B alpha/beta/delta family [Halogranum amylolyticum]
MTDVVTAFLRHRGRILLVRRSDAVGTYPDRWGGISGYVEGDPDDALTDARRELAEEVGVLDATLVRAGDPIEVVDGDREWTVHPLLFEWNDDGELAPNEELAAVEWVHPPAVLDRATVPALWAAYEAVAPTVADVRDDETHGSAYVSVRALEVLRDCAAVADDWAAVATVARELRDARPSMAALRNRIDRVMSEASEATEVNETTETTEAAEAGHIPEAVRDRAQAAVDDAVRADEEAAANAAELLSGTVLTLSRSGTVLGALLSARPDRVVVAESRPAREGVGVADELARAGLDVTLVTDAATGYVLAEESVDAAFVGADTVFADATVANKVGTRLLALAAARADVPLYVVTARDKISSGDDFHPEFGDAEAVYDGDRDVDVCNPIFDRTPGDLVAGLVTESGVLDADEVAEIAAEHRRMATWNDSNPDSN